MDYPPETMNAVSGMPPPRHPKDQHHSSPNYADQYRSPAYQVSPPVGFPQGFPHADYRPAPYAAMNFMNQQTQPIAANPSSTARRPSGVAVLIPGPSPSHVFRNTSLPLDSRPPIHSTQPNLSTSTPFPRPVASAHTVSQPSPIDYQLLLLSLAEDYLATAHSQARDATFKNRENTLRHYYKLVAAGLACLEAVIKKSKLQPQMEANVRLRYAAVLYEETENVLEAEQCLSDGIKLCDRYRIFDLKYNMEHLLAQVLFKGSPRASLKFLDGVIKDAEAYQHTAWIYALRFLKVSLLLRLSSHQDILSAFTQLRNISTRAEQSSDKAVLAVVSALEALVHLRQSSSAESIEQAQRAIALARTLQHGSVTGQIPQLTVLTNVLDLSCSLQQFDPVQSVAKMQAMQACLESPHDAWSADGSFLVPVSSPNASQAPTGSGAVRKDSKGLPSVLFSWAPWTDVYALGYLLSSLSIAHRNTSDGLRSEQMLKEGIRYLDRSAGKADSVLESISATASRHTWRRTLECFFRLHLVFALCTRTAWVPAQEQLQKLKENATSAPQKPEILDRLIQYLDGIINQGTGHLSTALSIFQRPCFSITTKPTSPAHTDLCILSTFNTILIVRPPTHPSHHTLPTLLSSLHPHLPRITATKPLLSAYNIILATTPSPSPPTIVRTKQYLQAALQAAKSAGSNQLTCVTLNFMSYKFFKGVVGEQAEKSARASENLARKGMDALWRSVSAGVVGDTLEMAGKGEEAAR
ncbi:MAG: hypothetical protein LQ345_007053, partial [Seirophora villosa]